KYLSSQLCPRHPYSPQGDCWKGFTFLAQFLPRHDRLDFPHQRFLGAPHGFWDIAATINNKYLMVGTLTPVIRDSSAIRTWPLCSSINPTLSYFRHIAQL